MWSRDPGHSYEHASCTRLRVYMTFLTGDPQEGTLSLRGYNNWSGTRACVVLVYVMPYVIVTARVCVRALDLARAGPAPRRRQRSHVKHQPPMRVILRTGDS